MDKFTENLFKKKLISADVFKELIRLENNDGIKAVIDYLQKKQCMCINKLGAEIAEYFVIDIFEAHFYQKTKTTESLFSLSQVEKYNFLPLKIDAGSLYLGVKHPLNPFLKEELRFKHKLKIKEILLSPEQFKNIKKDLYSNYFSLKQHEILKELDNIEHYDGKDIDKLKNIVEDAPIVKLLNKIIEEALSLNASDIHLETKSSSFEIRYRIDGLLKKYYELPVNIAAAVISRIKIISAMDITIRYLPQDGKLEYNFQGIDFDIRSSVIPTIHGEKAVLRLLLRNKELLQVDNLNFSEYNKRRFKKIINFRSGIILLSGPTGSGKTTTLFALLNKLASEKANIVTVENPVEYQLDALNQIEVNPAQGLSFAKILRFILRQDPDIIMIGEIRDRETAEIAVRAAVTGHLVLSTIHTTDSASAVVRLLDMGIEPFLLSSTINAVVAQRLLRKLCPYCKKETEEEFYLAEGCSFCSETGYQGRTPAAEILIVDERIRELISKKSTQKELKDAALDSGMLSLEADAEKIIKSGTSSREEVLRVINHK
ncbi:MAG: GspE/PulE family protein [Halanaerobium sp.]